MFQKQTDVQKREVFTVTKSTLFCSFSVNSNKHTRGNVFVFVSQMRELVSET